MAPTGDEVRKPECRRINTGGRRTRPCPRPHCDRGCAGEGLSLTPALQGQRVKRVEQTPTLASACVLRTTRTAIFEGTPDRAPAQARIAAWSAQVKASGLSCFDKFLNTLNNGQDGILNSFDGRYHRGFVEGLNTKLKLLKRRGFGLDDPVELFRRLGLDIEGARLWA